MLRYQRQGALLHSMQLPWVVIVDFSVPAAAMQKSEFAQRVGGRILVPDAQCTCDAGANSNVLDYVPCSTSVLMCVKPARPITAV
eukprot:2982976-Pyramimonas_sp.AAC.1